jgi:Flp pilus assembly protein TadB
VKLAKEIGCGVTVSALFLALTTILPIGAAIAVVIPFMALLALAWASERRDRHETRAREVMPKATRADC